MGHLLSRYFHTVPYYNALRKQNQPFFEKNLICAKILCQTLTEVHLAATGKHFFSTEALSSPEFIHRQPPVGKTTAGEKVEILSKAVGSFYGKQFCIHTLVPTCGKVLWKSLWRMWKTPCFQQVFSTLAFSGPLWKSLYRPLHISLIHRNNPLLCLQGREFFSWPNP